MEYELTAQQVPVPGQPGRFYYDGHWVPICAGKPIREQGRDGSLLTYATRELCEADFPRVRAILNLYQDQWALATDASQARDKASGKQAPAPPLPSKGV